MKYIEPTADVGVIIGRFQVAELHDGHRNLIEDVLARHDKVLILLGVSPLANSTNNPLDFESRKQMLMSAYPQVSVLYVQDTPSDEVWSGNVDAIVATFRGPRQTVLLYGSRDSFIDYYVGGYPTFELPSGHGPSGTEVRAALARRAADSTDWRAGAIWASANRYPTAYQAVDVAIFNEHRTQVLLGRKSYETQWRLIGGFSDPDSPSLEADASREAQEEASVELYDVRYVCSRKVDDWRYRREPDCIKTALFTAKTKTLNAHPGDDIVEVQWFNTDNFDEEHMWKVIPGHRTLITYALMGRNQ